MSQKQLPDVPKLATTDWRPIAVPHTNHLDDDKGRQRATKPWRPVTLQVPFLAAMTLSTAGLIILVQYLLALSTRQQGIIFARDINSLPLHKTFGYLYLPTIISVIYGLLWTWVDLDIKRLEPFFQLSRPGGANGSESILLSYPSEFLVTIPLSAFRRKHWSVLTASTIMILVFWGLTPTQAGIFAIRTVTVTENVPGTINADRPNSGLSMNVNAEYAQSVYNIAWLNETLPTFMTKDFILSPFGPASEAPSEAESVTYTGTTTLFSVDVSCSKAVIWDEPGAGIVRYNGSRGCSFYAPPYRPYGGNDTSKPFDTIYVGYQNQNGFADYYLSEYCDETFSHSFFVRWSKANDEFISSDNMAKPVKPGQANETALFCEPTYFRQQVNATVNLPSRSVVGVDALGAKNTLVADMFNSSAFEWTMSSGVLPVASRDGYPTQEFPDQKSRLLDLPLNLEYIPKTAPFAIATYPQSMDAYMDSDTLRLAYQATYRLLFARQLADIADIRGTELSQQGTLGYRTYNTQAVVVVSSFAYIATAILVCILMLALFLAITTARRANKMYNDPGNIGSLMDVTRCDKDLLGVFSDMHSYKSSDLDQAAGEMIFRLNDAPQASIVLGDAGSSAMRPDICDREEDHNLSESNAKGVRPVEMRLVIGSIFLALQISALVVFLALFLIAGRTRGLQLPSNSTFVRQLVENYIPIVFTTFIEPFWLVLNRLLCLLQPFEELRKRNALSSRSIDIDYSSLPPQLLFYRAFRARHFALGCVCLMMLSANALAVALSGLMYEGTVDITMSSTVSSSKVAQIVPLNGTGLPFNVRASRNWQGGTTSDPFYREVSNLTADTPLPPWADELYAYVPVDLSTVPESTSIVEVETQGYSTSVQCQQLNTTGDEHYSLSFSADASRANFSVILQMDGNGSVKCTNLNPWTASSDDSDIARAGLNNPQSGHSAIELNSMLSSLNGSTEEELFCRQHIFLSWIRADWSLYMTKETLTNPNLDLDSKNITALLCVPRVLIVDATIQVNTKGEVQQRLSESPTTNSNQAAYWSSSDLAAQANQFLIDSDSTWHNDSYPSDFINYLMKQSSDDSSFLDSSLPVPEPDEAAERFSTMYQKLFALLISTNSDYLLANATSVRPIQAKITTSETRILFSTPAFVVVEVILSCYIITTIVFYTRRPWRILPRLPSNPASIIAYFAASRTLISEDEGDGKAARAQHRWGFGVFAGADGKIRRGIEREPLLKERKTE